MRDLIKYLNGIDYLDNQVLIHAQTSIYFNESSYYKCPQNFVFESTGLFPKCQLIINYIDDHIEDLKNDRDEWIIKSSDIDKNIFFDELRIHFIKGNNFYGEYEIGDEATDEIKWDDRRKKFNFIDIDIYGFVNESKNELLELLTHELQHAWDDYILRANGASLRDKHIVNDFNDMLDELQRNLQQEISMAEDETIQKKYQQYIDRDIPYFRQALYYLDRFEGSAYIAQINQLMNGKKFKDPISAMQYIKDKSCTYNNYKILYELFNDKRCSRRLTDIGFKTSAINKYIKISQKIWGKVVNHTYHIILQHLIYNDNREDCFYKIPRLNDFK